MDSGQNIVDLYEGRIHKPQDVARSRHISLLNPNRALPDMFLDGIPKRRVGAGEVRIPNGERFEPSGGKHVAIHERENEKACDDVFPAEH
jgi:hypothetical protein